MNDAFPILANIPYSAVIRDLFRKEDLWKQWYERYPELFDERDLSNVANQAKSNSHFHEWLGAVLFFQMTGWYSLQQKYQFNHRAKRTVLEKLNAYKLIDFFSNQKEKGWGNLQAPDLLVYAPDYTDWYMLEIKGPTDSLRAEQKRYFEALMESVERPIKVLHLTLLHPMSA